MRPIKLELEGFTVYRKRTYIDFSNLDFFIIQGRTGAGKTSIIDAICYALYGKVPRHKDKSLNEHLISYGSGSMRVYLDFSVKGKHYRIERYYGKNVSEVRFYENGKPLNLKKSDVEKYISEIIGLDYDTFTKVIILPQGQFDRFLKPEKPSDRRDILNKLLGFDEFFEKAQEVIKRRYDTIRNEKVLKEALLNQYSCITPQAIEEEENKITELNQKIELLEKEREALEREKLL